MELNKLVHYNKKFLFKIIGNYINQKRLASHLTIEATAEIIKIPPKEYKLIESGIKYITQEQFDILDQLLKFDEKELFELVYISESNYLVDVFRALDENFPK